MLLKQYYLNCLAHASYLIGDPSSGTAVVVDPQRDTDAYIADAEKAGLQIRHVFLTHFHADFLAGHLELRNRTGADLSRRQGPAEFAFTPMQADGDSLDLGRVRLTVLETPGHTVESISILVFDLDADARQPQAIPDRRHVVRRRRGRPDLRVAGLVGE
jgi:glyoxylase-like metal-dependent hydrolase (beta-lactamase superfamily II)